MTESKSSSSSSVGIVVPFMIATMLIAGSGNTLLTKMQNNASEQAAEYLPLLQTYVMLIGECLCFAYYGILKFYEARRQLKEGTEPHPIVDNLLGISDAKENPVLSGSKQLLFAIPAACDAVGTTFMMIGYLYVPASIFQIFRGSLIAITAVFATVFLGVHYKLYKWLSILVIFAGLCIVGYAAVLNQEIIQNEEAARYAAAGIELPGASDDGQEVQSAASLILYGLFFVVVGQFFPATQFIVEETILKSYAVSPIKAVGLEGASGLVICSILIPIGYAIFPRLEIFQFHMAINYSILYDTILYTHIAVTFCISVFNFTGLAIARMLSSTTRTTIDTCRTLIVWIVSLLAGTERFHYLQLIGFCVFITGTFLFNDIIPFPFIGKSASDEEMEGENKRIGAADSGNMIEEPLVQVQPAKVASR